MSKAKSGSTVKTETPDVSEALAGTDWFCDVIQGTLEAIHTLTEPGTGDGDELVLSECDTTAISFLACSAKAKVKELRTMLEQAHKAARQAERASGEKKSTHQWSFEAKGKRAKSRKVA